MKSLFKGLFALPSPKDLGRADSNFLPSRWLTPETDEYAREDYYKEVKEKYPIRYFFRLTLVNWFKSYIWCDSGLAPLQRWHYWLASHTTRKYHLLDLRQPKNSCDQYRWGWIDSDLQMLYACFNILKSYVEEEKPYFLTEEDVARDESLRAQYEHGQEIKALYHYWTVERKVLADKRDLLLKKWSKAWHEQRDSAMQELNKFEDEFAALEDLMLVRLIKARRGMWT